MGARTESVRGTHRKHNSPPSLLQNRHQIHSKMWCIWPLVFAGRRSVIVAFEGAVMRIIVLAAVLAASCALGGCFHFHTSQVYSAPQALPPLK